MRKGCVTVIDIRSTEICAVIAEQGVNHTFNIKSLSRASYDGYAEGKLLDEQSFIVAVQSVLDSLNNTSNKPLKKLYVGIPGEFIRVHTQATSTAFPRRKRVGTKDVDELYRQADIQDEKFTMIHNAAPYFVLSDQRRVVDPTYCLTDSLAGELCFYLADSHFLNVLSMAVAKWPTLNELIPIPTCYAMAMYLLPSSIRDSGASLLDIGEISSSYSYVFGNAVCYHESFSVGMGHVAAQLMDELSIPYSVARQLIGQVNLNCIEGSSRILEVQVAGQMYSFASSMLRNKIKEMLDGICELIETCRQNNDKQLTEQTIHVTGEGVNAIKGAVDHMAGRLVCQMEVTSPSLPCYDKPQWASLFSLLQIALNDNLDK